MEVKKGCKKTEAGVIPEDWTVKLFKEICWVNQGLQIAIEKRLKLPTETSKIYITIQFLNNSKQIEYINDYNSSVCCNESDILMTRTGNTGIVVTGVNGVFHNNFFKINYDKTKIIKDFFVYYLRQNKTKKIILDKAGTSTIPDLNHRDFYSITIPLPPTKSEQVAIANALSDADAWIQSLTCLIDKKRQIKQGAMQSLLNPYKNGRLKVGWVMKKLGDFLDYEQPTAYLVSDTEYNDNNNTPVLTAGKTFILGYTHEEFGIFKNVLPVIIFDDFTTANKFVTFPFKAKSSAMKILKKKNNKVNLRFIYELMQQINYPLGDHKRHWIGEFQHLDIIVPELETEQTRIANILSDMDNEIIVLETKLAKAQQIKQGMMQNLLTGRIRLI